MTGVFFCYARDPDFSICYLLKDDATDLPAPMQIMISDAIKGPGALIENLWRTGVAVEIAG